MSLLSKTDQTRTELRDMLRMWPTLVIALITLGVIHVIAPQQTGIIVYKTCSLSLAAYLGYWVDRWCFHETRPSDLFCQIDVGEEFHGRLFRLIRWAVSEIRRAAIIVATIIGSAMLS